MSERASERPGARALAAAETFASARASGSRGRRLLPPLPSRPAAAAAHAGAGAPAGAEARAGARGRGAGRRLPRIGTGSCSAGRGRPRGAGLSASPRGVGRRTPQGVGRGSRPPRHMREPGAGAAPIRARRIPSLATVRSGRPGP